MFALRAAITLTGIILGMAYASRIYASSSSTITRKVVASGCIVATALTVTALILSSIYHGPASLYAEGSMASAIRTWIILPGNFASLLLPVVFAVLLVALRRPSHKPSFLALAITAIVSIPISLVLAIVISCNHAGVCF